MAHPQPESYDYDEMPHYPHRHRSRYYYDPDNHLQSPMNRHSYHEHKPHHHHHPYDEIPLSVPIMPMIPNHSRHRRMPKPHSFNNQRKYRRGRRKPTIRGYVYGFRANENDD